MSREPIKSLDAPPSVTYLQKLIYPTVIFMKISFLRLVHGNGFTVCPWLSVLVSIDFRHGGDVHTTVALKMQFYYGVKGCFHSMFTRSSWNCF